MAKKGRDINERSMDPAAQAILIRADALGIGTAFSRVENMAPCTVGSGKSGMCCKNCFMGPCRITKDGQVGICGATLETIAARNLARAIAAGAAAHSDHGRDLAFTLEAVALGQAPGYAIRDVGKLWDVAARVGVRTEGRPVNDVALDVAHKSLAEFGQQRGELTYLKHAPKKRYELWKKQDLAPRGIDREVIDTLHRTHIGVDQDYENIVEQCSRAAIADGWGGSMIATDLQDVLFGCPYPVKSTANLGVLKEDHVNLVIHGHEPLLSEMIVQAAELPELVELANAKGAKGIQLSGICCTANEILMRHGVPLAGDFLQQELAIVTGAVDAMVVDVQCIMQALPNVASNFHTKVITTSPKVKMPGALHMEFDEHRALQVAKDIVRLAIDNYPNRGEVMIPDVKSDVVPGFSHEYLNYMLGGSYRGSFRPLNDAIMSGRIRGAAAVVGCNNPKVTQDKDHIDITAELLKNDVLVVQTGCGAIAAGKYGMLLGEAAMEMAGPGLREVCEAVGIPPVLHMGSCVDNSRILTVLTQMATEGGLGEDVSDLPAVGIAPEWMSEKALAIGTYAAASGAYVLFGVESPYAFSEEVSDLISAGWEEMMGGKMEFLADPKEIVRRSLAHIDKKRAELKLPVYDPTKYGKSGDYPLQDYFELPIEEQQAMLYGMPA